MRRENEQLSSRRLDVMLDASIYNGGDKHQSLGRQIISTLYMLVRNIKIHTPDNTIFLKPIDLFRETINSVLAGEGAVNLKAAETSVYLNDVRLKLDFSALNSIKYLTHQFERVGIGGFTASRPVTSSEIRDFLYIFLDAETPFGETNQNIDGQAGICLLKYSKVKEIIDKLEHELQLEQRIDRKKYLLTVYARTIFFMKKYIERLASGKTLLPLSRVARLVQELIDLCYAERVHFLGVTTVRASEEYLVYHSVNIALLSIVFGQELGLDRRQLHNLGMAGLFSSLGMVEVPSELINKPGSLSKDERYVVDLSPLRTVRHLLASRGFNKESMLSMVAIYESYIDYALLRKTNQDQTVLIIPKRELSLYAKIINICSTYDALTSKRPFRDAYGPEIALALMCHELKYRFDPNLLRIFMKVMAIQPLRILGPQVRRIRMV